MVTETLCSNTARWVSFPVHLLPARSSQPGKLNSVLQERLCITAFKQVSLTTDCTVLTVPYVLLFVITASRSSAALACSAANSGVTIPLRSVEQNLISTFFIITYATSIKQHSVILHVQKYHTVVSKQILQNLYPFYILLHHEILSPVIFICI